MVRFSLKAYGRAVSALVAAAVTTSASAQSVTGPSNPCAGSTQTYRLSKQPPYYWHFEWTARGAIITNQGTENGNCYTAIVQLSRQPADLRFTGQYNGGVADNFDKHVVPRVCAAVKKKKR
jgi:hypothetical protein